MLNNRSIYLFIAVIYTCILLYFSLANADNVLPETDIKYQDKILHLGAYIVLAFLWGFYVLKAHFKKGVIYSFFATLAFGIILEAFQEAINPLRTFDIYDLLANCFGVIIGTIIVTLYKKHTLK